jgi:hypothetical protein
VIAALLNDPAVLATAAGVLGVITLAIVLDRLRRPPKWVNQIEAGRAHAEAEVCGAQLRHGLLRCSLAKHDDGVHYDPVIGLEFMTDEELLAADAAGEARS